MDTQNADCWDNRELGASEDHVGTVAFDLEVDENNEPLLEVSSETQ